MNNPYIPDLNKKLLLDGNIIDIDNLTIKELMNKFKSLFIITLNDIDLDVFQMQLNETEYIKLKNNIVLKQVNFNILKLTHAKKSLMILNKNHINNINYIDFNNIKQNFNHDEYILVICWFEFYERAISNYIKQYNFDVDIYTIYDIICIDIYTKYDKYNESNNLIRLQMINNIYESNYWCLFNNCKLNITIKFIDRHFNFKECINLDDNNIKNIINKLDNIDVENHNYLAHMYRKQIYIDASSCINKTGFKLYNIIKENTLDYMDINLMLITSRKKNDREYFTLVSNLLISKQYCHYIVNNKSVLDNFHINNDTNISLLQKYCLYWSHLWSYAWLTLYLEECIKKTHISENDRFVFNINTANKLPYFPSCCQCPKLSPYIPLLVSDEILSPQYNNLGVETIISKNYLDFEYIPGITTLDKFRDRFNIFISGNKIINYFDNINWNNMAICGSIMAACVPRYNPLIYNFPSNLNNDDLFKLYIDRYYHSADIDIMINIKGLNFIDKVHHIIDTVNNNILKYHNVSNEVNYTTIKTVCILIDEKFILQLLDKKPLWKLNKNFTIEYIIKNINSSDIIKEEIYNYYVLLKNQDNEQFNDEYKSNYKYKIYFDIIPIDNITIYFISDTKNDIHHNISSFLFKYDETIKYKVNSIYLQHNLEIFQIKYEEFFSTVSKFHMPIVRSYYNGNDVYLLPSCISACMTFMNIDYKYFSGSKDPISIINKYRSRGFGTYLNDKEKIYMIDYINDIPELKSIYMLNIKNTNSINNVLKELPYNHNLFLDKTCSIVYNISFYNKLRITKDIYNLYEKFFDIKIKSIFKDIMIDIGLSCIKSNGYINIFKKWLIDFAYENH